MDVLRDKAHLHIFGRYFFPHIIQGKKDVPECHLDLIRELSSPRDSASIFPRGFSKSTWEKIDTIHDIVYGLEELILYIGDTVTDAGFHFEAIKAELEGNQMLKDVYGDLVPAENLPSRKWTAKHFETSNGVIAIARGRQKGRGVNIKNKRPTKIIIDDAENDQMTRKADQRQKFHDWLYNVVFPSMNPKRGRVKMIGTAIHQLAEVVQFYKKHGGIYRRAIEDGKSIWPAMFPLSDLKSIRDGGVLSNGKVVKGVGTRAFNREYMNNPTADDEAAIKEEWITENYFTMLPPQWSYEAVAQLDPQAGEKRTADEWSIAVVYSAKGQSHRYIQESIAGRGSQLDQAKEVVRCWRRNKAVMRVIGVESVLNQTSVWRILLDWKARRVDFNTADMCESFKKTGIRPRGWINEMDRNIPIMKTTPTKDKKARLERFEADFERGEIHLKPEQEELAHQLMHNVGKGGDDHDDRADAAIGALEIAGRKVRIDPKALPDKPKKRYNTTIVGNIMDKKY